MSKNYIFGYGSLIHTESVSTAVVKGIERQWNLIAPEYSMTAVGALCNSTSYCNGVIVPVNAQRLRDLDQRELPHGYRREIISQNDVEGGPNCITPEDLIWTYVIISPGLPSEENPIVQSYLDVVLTGCLNISDDFAREFITTTSGWDNPWVNDRSNPRYPRSLGDVPLSERIDSMLYDLVPEDFIRRQDI